MERKMLREQESSEPIEKLLLSTLEHGDKLDEGQNAVVLKIRPEDLGPDERQQLLAVLGEEQADKALASKVLRFFSAGHSRQEADNQIKAKKIVDSQSAEEKDDLAKVPEIYFHRDINIHDGALKEKLRHLGVDISSDKLGVLLMYKVEGVDFLNYLLQEVIKRTSKDDLLGRSAAQFAQEELAKDRHGLSTEDVFKIASGLAGFEPSERIKLSQTNRDRLLKYLEKHGFTLDPKIFNKLERTIKLLNDHNFYHNDLTERNIMFEFDEDGSISDVYMIDFEKAATEADNDFGGELSILGNYRVFLQSKDERLDSELKHSLASAESLRLRVAKMKPDEYTRLEKTLMGTLQENDLSGILLAEKMFLASAEKLVSNQAYELLAAMLADLARTEAEVVKKYINLRLTDKTKPNQLFNLLSRIKHTL